jgi:hypothetical protein
MSSRIEQELELLRSHWPDLEYRPDENWVRLPSYSVPPGWTSATVEVCFRIPEEAATAPYGFYVKPGLLVVGAGGHVQPSNYTPGAATPFGDGWAMFSWSPLGWQPAAQVAEGDNMLHFVRSFRDRLAEPS